MNHSKLFHTVIILLVLLLATVVAATPIHESGRELRQSVIALDRARSRSVHDLTQKQQNSTLNGQEQQDYEKFISFLAAKISEYCRQLITEEGETAAAGLPCPAGGQVLFDTHTDPTLTSAEQVADLEKVLAESLGQFDENLLKEEERLAARQLRARESGYDYDDGPDGSENGQGGSVGSSGQDTGSGQTSQTGDMPGQDSEEGDTTGARATKEVSGSATGTGDRTGAVPGEASGSIEDHGSEQTAGTASQSGQQELESGYDDIVARQLREAAEKETDPELKKKLWEEYRKYKDGVR